MAIPPNSHLKVPARGDLPGIDRANAAALLSRGLTRFFAAHGLVSLPEFTLRSGRRADLLCFDAKCRITLVEIKSSVEDFRCDQKWPEYLEYCDQFYRSEEHTSELQSLMRISYAVFCLKKKNKAHP